MFLDQLQFTKVIEKEFEFVEDIVADLVYPLVFHVNLSSHVVRHEKSVNFSLKTLSKVSL